LRFDQNPGMAPSLNDCSGTFEREGGKKSVLSHTVESGDTGGRKAFASMSDVSIRTLRSATSQKDRVKRSRAAYTDFAVNCNTALAFSSFMADVSGRFRPFVTELSHMKCAIAVGSKRQQIVLGRSVRIRPFPMSGRVMR
jgi:hypothetical protein